MKKTINANTPQPFTVTRNLWTWDADGENERYLKAVRITISNADFSAEAVEEEGFNGDWEFLLSNDPRFPGLDAGQVEAAEDSACHFVEELASRLARGEDVPTDADADRIWYPLITMNL